MPSWRRFIYRKINCILPQFFENIFAGLLDLTIFLSLFFYQLFQTTHSSNIPGNVRTPIPIAQTRPEFSQQIRHFSQAINNCDANSAIFPLSQPAYGFLSGKFFTLQTKKFLNEALVPIFFHFIPSSDCPFLHNLYWFRWKCSTCRNW